jgi:hypothetical protein
MAAISPNRLPNCEIIGTNTSTSSNARERKRAAPNRRHRPEAIRSVMAAYLTDGIA